jgi:hypothetical protein
VLIARMGEGESPHFFFNYFCEKLAQQIILHYLCGNKIK